MLLLVCTSIFLCKITRKVMDRFGYNFQGMLIMPQGPGAVFTNIHFLVLVLTLGFLQ